MAGGVIDWSRGVDIGGKKYYAQGVYEAEQAAKKKRQETADAGYISAGGNQMMSSGGQAPSMAAIDKVGAMNAVLPGGVDGPPSMAGLRTASSGSGTGGTSIDDQIRLMQEEARLGSEAETKRQGYQTAARGEILGAMGPTGGATAPVQHGASGGAEPDVRAAAFARAKDQAGKIARASLTAVAEQAASKGISGGGWEALQSAGAITGASQPLQDLNVRQMEDDVNRAADVSDMTYTGGIAQRGQDLTQRQSYLNLLRGLY